MRPDLAASGYAQIRRCEATAWTRQFGSKCAYFSAIRNDWLMNTAGAYRHLRSPPTTSRELPWQSSYGSAVRG
jgi:hypothetical protein